MKHVLLHLLSWLNANYLPAHHPLPPPPVRVTSSAQLLPAVSTKALTRRHARNYYYKTKLTNLKICLLSVSVFNPIFTLSLFFFCYNSVPSELCMLFFHSTLSAVFNFRVVCVFEFCMYNLIVLQMETTTN